MDEAESMFLEYQQATGISRRKFCKLMGIKASRLRDHMSVHRKEKLKAKAGRKVKQVKAIKVVAEKHATAGYRNVYQHLIKDKYLVQKIGMERVRKLMAELGLQQTLPKKRSSNIIEVTTSELWPVGRRLQIDATKTEHGWVYIVLDVTSRAVLSTTAVTTVNAINARSALRKAVAVLHRKGIFEDFLIMSDGGSDFTSALFQDYCSSLGSWVRARVNQKGGMGILERLNRTFKYDYLFRLEINSLQDLHDSLKDFRSWYNTVRLHSSLNYQTPWSVLLHTAILSNNMVEKFVA